MLIYAIGKLYHMPWEKKSNNSRKRRFSAASALVNSLYEELFLFYNIIIRRWHLYMLQKSADPDTCRQVSGTVFCSLYKFPALCTPFGFVSPDERAHLSSLTAAPLRSAPRLRFCSPAFQDGRRRWNRTSPASRTRRPRRGRGPSCPL